MVSVIRPDFDADAYVGQLWTVPLDPEKLPRRLTRGFRDTAPAFSPDGLVLAFLRAAAGGKPQLHVVEAAGGEPQVLTDAPLGVCVLRLVARFAQHRLQRQDAGGRPVRHASTACPPGPRTRG